MSIYKNLEGYWTLDTGKSDSGSAKDSTPNDNHGTIDGASETSGVVNEGLQFSSSSDEVRTTSTYSPSTFTFSGFLYYSELDTTSNADHREVVWSATDGRFILIEENSALNVRIPNVSSTLTAGGSTSLNTWHHFACVYDGADIIGYIDGDEVTRRNIGSVSPTLDSLEFAPNTSNSYNSLIGRLDELMLHNRALSPSEIQTLANKNDTGVNMPLYQDLVIDFDHRPDSEDSGVIRNETPYSEYDATDYSITYGTTGIKTSENADFSGSGDYIALPNAGMLTDGISEFSIETTIKPDTTSGRQTLFESGDGANGFNYYIDSGTFYFGVWAEDNGWSGSWISTSSGTSWQHFVMTFNSSGNMKLFKDGSMVDSGSPQSQLPTHGGDNSLGKQGSSSKYHDGDDTTSDTYYFDGRIGLTRMWERGLSESEATDLNEQSLVKKVRY